MECKHCRRLKTICVCPARGLECIQCKKPLEGRQRRFCSIFCGKECRRVLLKESKECYQCKVCGNESNRKKQFCSVQCRNKSKRKKPRTFTCNYCKTEFVAIWKRKFCAKKCCDKARQTYLIHTCTCINCNAEFQHRLMIKRYCPSCSFTAGNCLVCGQVFNGRFDKIYCGKKCRERAHRRSINAYARKAIKNAIIRSGEKIEPYKVFKRDGWICKICGDPIDNTLMYPDLMSASLDHKIALANGGSHTYDNVQCAHLICNSLKGNNPPDKVQIIINNYYGKG